MKLEIIAKWAVRAILGMVTIGYCGWAGYRFCLFLAIPPMNRSLTGLIYLPGFGIDVIVVFFLLAGLITFLWEKIIRKAWRWVWSSEPAPIAPIIPSPTTRSQPWRYGQRPRRRRHQTKPQVAEVPKPVVPAPKEAKDLEDEN